MNPPPPPPPPPPPHGQYAKASDLPHGKYDIFIVPPEAAGAGFIYFPSLKPNRNSFLAGAASATIAIFVGQIVLPVLKEWFYTVLASSGTGGMLLLLGVGIAGWAWGKTQVEGTGPGPAGNSPGGTPHPSASHHAPPPPQPEFQPPPRPPPQAPPRPTWQRASAAAGGAADSGAGAAGAARGAWERAREETKKKEEERKKKEEEEKKAKESIWERAKAREKEAKEREAREKERKERAERGDAGRKAAASAPNSPRKHEQPTARTYHGTEESEYSFRPYDKPKTPLRKENSHSSIYSESSYAPSASTSRTTPPPSMRGPYTTKDPDKIVIKAVYSYNNTFTKTPTAQLISGTGSVTDGLILRVTTEGLFIDDDVRGVPQREWDVKAWTMKLVESGDFKGLHVLRATIRDQDGKRYVFVLGETEGWKVAVGLQRLRRGSQVRALGVSGMSQADARNILTGLGWG